jgi:hypothetical protein
MLKCDSNKTLPNELALRAKLGIPTEAKKVLIFGESSHWDPNWLQTSHQYFNQLVQKNMDMALKELEKEPTRIYSVECMFFMRMYWDSRPENQGIIRELANSGRLRFTSSGVTTSDTLIPSTEAILRDLLLGQDWLRENEITQEPRMACFPDCFGHSPFLPELLHAAGFDMTSFYRIDGMYSVAADFDPRSSFPRPGSTAKKLLEEEKTLDFIWKGHDGSELLSHWNAFSYFQGDMLAYSGIMRISNFPIYYDNRSENHVASRIHSYVKQLAPYSRTPYLFCPIGMDFTAPIPGLVSLLDRYNRVRYPQTGIWVTNLALDDYLVLVNCYRQNLPILHIDPNPYWTGFYTSRPSLKQRSFDLAEQLQSIEALALMQNDPLLPGQVAKRISPTWWILATSNHHDFITGTAPDKVVAAEQQPILDQALSLTKEIIEKLEPTAYSAALPVRQDYDYTLQDGILEVTTPYYLLRFSEKEGGMLVFAQDHVTKIPLTGLPTNDLICYKESGGLWRMGHEYKGGYLKEVDRASHHPIKFILSPTTDGLLVSWESIFMKEKIQQMIWIPSQSRLVYFGVKGKAPSKHTITMQFATHIETDKITMENPGGIITRNQEKLYSPTFWNVQQFSFIQDNTTSAGVAIFFENSGAIALRPKGILEPIALRNAQREIAYGILPIPATPAVGNELEDCTFTCALLFTAEGDWKQNNLPNQARNLQSPPWTAEKIHPTPFISQLFTTNRPDVIITSIKPAWRGNGIIIRLFAYAPVDTIAHVYAKMPIEQATLCDARERDISSLQVDGRSVILPVLNSITTIRVTTLDD